MLIPDFSKFLLLTGAVTVLGLGASGCAALPPVSQPSAELMPYEAQYDFAVGQIAEQNRDWAQAAAAYRRALRADPESLVLWQDLVEMLMQSGRAGQAVEEFRAALKKHEADPEWVFLMGEIADAAGNTVEAQHHYRRAVNSAHPTAAMFTALGVFLLDQAEEAEALVFLEKALALDPHARAARLAEVEAAIDREDYARARSVLLAALAADPDDEEWLFRLGKVEELSGREKSALQTYQRLLEIDPENPEARRALAEIYLRARDYAQALPWLESLQRSEPQDALVKRNLGAAYFELGQWEAARPLLKELAEQHKADAVTHFMLGAIYRQKSLWLLAEQELNAARNAPELHLDAELELAGVWIEQGERVRAAELLAELIPELQDQPRRLLRYALAALRLEEAAQAGAALQRALVLSPGDPELCFHLGRVFLAQKKISEAVQAWLQAVRRDPKFSEAWNHLGYTCAENGIRLPEAEGWARRAVALEPENGNYHDSLGWVYFQEGKYAPALEELQRALECFRSHPADLAPEVYDHLGEVYSKLNRREDALRAWRRALGMNPKDLRLQEKISKFEQAGK
ncbi:MAG: tetratricopeptide repeat protein [Candidatus Firestonebacteria bacterium]|nr:tetratricopeptide repeat protein [Candidatus Firestonebacteria bacterium]